MIAQKIRHSIGLSLVLVITLSSVVLSIFPSQTASAASWNAGRIIDDSVFTDTTSMSVSEIQTFLNNKNSVCLKNYQTSEPLGNNNYGGNVSAAHAIWKAGQLYGINPRVLLVTLQKEQGLITRSDCPTWRYNAAMGFGCPDSAPCDAQWYGLSKQLYQGARHLKGFYDQNAGWYIPYRPGVRYIQWHPNSGCGGTNVNIENRATASLYSYTPYQPNAAAINAGYGLGDGCSAYGNRNFLLYFNDWFGFANIPELFKTAGSGTVYLRIDNYKHTVPSIAVLQDYGHSPASIATISEQEAAAILPPPTESSLSHSVGTIVKSESDGDADGGAVYLISIGKRYSFSSMAQFESYGFSVSDIKYLPLGYINRFPGAPLSNYIQTPSSNVFSVADGKKHIFLDYEQYISQNPSDNYSYVSDYVAGLINSGTANHAGAALIKVSGNSAVYLTNQTESRLVPNMDVFSCWGFNAAVPSTTLFVLPEAYITLPVSSGSLNCVSQIGVGSFLLDGNARRTIPSEFGLSGVVYPSDFVALAGSLPESGTLSRYVKYSQSQAVYYLADGSKYYLPSMLSLSQNSIPVSSIQILGSPSILTVTTNGAFLGNGMVVKSPSSPAVYFVDDFTRHSFSSIEDLYSHGYEISDIVTIAEGDFSLYPTSGKSLKRFVSVTQNGGQSFRLHDELGCYNLTGAQVGDFNQSTSNIISDQEYATQSFYSLSGCKSFSGIAKSNNSQTVYRIIGGQKRPYSSYTSLQSQTENQIPTIDLVSTSILSGIPTGASY